MSRKLNKFVQGLVPVADAFAGTVTTDIVSLKNYGHAKFIIFKGAGATGTSTITLEACDDFSGSTSEAVAFTYQAVTSGDTPAALVTATTAGFATTAGANQLYIIDVDTNALASSTYDKIRLKAVEVVNSPVAGAVVIELEEPRIAKEIPPTAIA